MSRTGQWLGALAVFALLCGCGGASSSQVPQNTAGVTSSTSSTSPTSATTPGPVAQAQLTIKYAPVVYAKLAPSAAASAKQRAAGSARRFPTFVDPGSTNYLDIFVDGTDVTNPGSPNVNNSSDGTQTFNMALTSNVTHQIVAVETNNGFSGLSSYSSSILALGEYDLSFSPGTAPAIGLTMLMNVTQLGVMTSTTGANAQVGSPYYVYCSDYLSPVYLFAADANGGFVPNGGLGAPVPSLLSWSSDQPNTGMPNTLTTAGNSQNPGYAISFSSYSSGGLTIVETVGNPAYGAINNQGGLYNGIASLINNYILNTSSISSNAIITNSIDFQLNCD